MTPSALGHRGLLRIHKQSHNFVIMRQTDCGPSPAKNPGNINKINKNKDQDKIKDSYKIK
jgi:hypothetical protein